MQTTGKLFDDLARVANGAAGAASGIRAEIEGIVRQRLERLLSDMDLVPRDEFEAIKAVAQNARTEQEKLEERVAALEAAQSGQAVKARTGARSVKHVADGKSSKQ